MRALTWRRPTADQLKGTGLRLKHYVEPKVDVWPENWSAIALYVQSPTQWIQGPGGPTGLNYPWFMSEMQRKAMGSDEIDETMNGLRVIEDAVLDKVYSSK